MSIKRTQYVARPAGSAGSAVATKQFNLGSGVLRFIKIDYGSGVPATTDILVKADSTSGATLLTRTSSTTDIGPIAVGTAGMDEAGAASAATDGLAGGLPFSTGLFVDIAQADPYVNSTDEITIDLYWEPLKKKQVVVTATGDAGSAAGETLWTNSGRPGVLRFVKVDFHADNAATANFVISRDTEAGTDVFTLTDTETDVAVKAVGTTAGDEAFAATAATDAVDGGIVFNRGLSFSVIETDAATTTVDFWYE
jgi:hypothetical protein